MVKENSIEESIVRNIRDENVVFVFPTEVACKGWADWTIRNSDRTGVSAVAMERFIAWDVFKGDCIRTKQEDKSTVPSLMRKIFASYLIEKNAEIKKNNINSGLNDKPIFKSLITYEFADGASSFSDWIAKIFPSLKIWKSYHDTDSYKNVIEEMKKEAELSGKEFSLSCNDDEDDDYEKLYEEYKNFLDENDLFDPAWEQPPFTSTDEKTKFVIIYPQVLEDWTQYEFLLRMAEKEDALSFVDVPKNIEIENTAWCHFDTSVEELHNVAQFLRKKHDEDGIAWTDMALSVPNVDSYGSYIERELTLFEIPAVARFSRMLSEHGAGKIFFQIQECVRTDFAFESVKSLLLNDDIPWKNKYLIDSLIMFGKENNCVCSYADIDIWEESFKNPVHRISDDKIPERVQKREEKIAELSKFYGDLKNSTTRMVRAKSFRGLLRAYRTFRRIFIDRNGFEEMKKSDLILSRCIAELTSLVELENEYCTEEKRNSGIRKDGKTAYRISNVFGFFVSHLEQTQYLDQTEERGVQIFPYRAAAACPFKVHVVVDATQDSLSVGSLFKQLNFLNESKRNVILRIDPETNDKFFKFTEFDPSESFISLYQVSASENSFFTSAEQSFGKYGFPHGFLKGEKRVAPFSDKNAFAKEKLSFVSSDFSFPSAIMKTQKEGFDSWKMQLRNENQNSAENSTDSASDSLNVFSGAKIRSIIDKKFFDKTKKKYKISPSNIKSFYKCPRQWLFEKILSLRPLNNEADLMNDFVVGRINHAIFEEYLTAVKNLDVKFSDTLEKVLDENKEITGYGELLPDFKAILSESIEKANGRFVEPGDDEEEFGETLSEMTKKIILSQKDELFVKILPSVVAFSKFFSGMKVYRLEEQYTAHPKNDDGTPKKYYFDGRIDCVLKSESADDEKTKFFIIDFKTGGIPNTILFDEEKPSELPDFQMPIYRKIFFEGEKYANGENIEPANYFFFSIKNCTVNGKTKVENAFLDLDEFDKTCRKCDELIEDFVLRIQNLDFSIDEKIQKKSLCTAKGGAMSCKDYQSVCRRFFTVAGE